MGIRALPAAFAAGLGTLLAPFVASAQFCAPGGG
jgi:hypothetical protein